MSNISSYKIKGLNLGSSALTILRNTVILVFSKGHSLGSISSILVYSVIRSVAIIVIIDSGSFKGI
jgi:hypothetical protein